jgi:hypothetical protein
MAIMTNPKQDAPVKKPPKHTYPAVYDKLIPIAIGIITLAIILLLVVVVGVITGFIPWTGY